MALDSNSTMADALAQYNDNLAWDGAAAKARLALEAVRWLLVNRAQSSSDGAIRIDFEALESEKRKLEALVAATANARAGFVQARANL